MKLVFATHNINKLREIKALLDDSIELLSLSDIGCDEDIPETAPTIAGNALIKAQYVKDHYGYDCFADDTGLEVEALQGAPGVYSARYAGPQKRDADNIEKLLSELSGKTNRKAQFKTVISFVTDSHQKDFVGICKGEILPDLKGENGFGYDPIFKPEGFQESFAQMDPDQKNKISHRGKAFKKFIEYLHSHKLT